MNPIENDATEFLTVDATGTVKRHKLAQLELPLGYPGTPKDVKATIKQVADHAEIVEDLDDQDSETEAVIRD